MLYTLTLISLSIHDLTRRSTSKRWAGDRPSYPLSIHDLTRRSTTGFTPKNAAVLSFNSRPHKEVDVMATSPFSIQNLSIHDLTRRSTEHTGHHRGVADLSIHDLTRRSTDWCSGHRPQIIPFNSRPHKEVDSSGLSVCAIQNLSIHDLTRRSTSTSGHTWSIWPFQFTTSQGGRQNFRARNRKS